MNIQQRKSYSSIFSFLFIILIVSTTECKRKNDSYNGEENKQSTPIARLDSEKRANDLVRLIENCNEGKIKSAFLEWKENYYPDWPIKGKIKIFEVPNDHGGAFGLGSPCPHNIRFQTVDPHMGEFGEKEIIIVRFAWTDERFEGFSIKPVRGTLY